VEADEGLMERYLEGEKIGDAELAPVVTRAIQQGSLVPVFATSAAREIGVAEMLDVIAAFFPSPVEAGPAKATKPGTDEQVERAPTVEAPFGAQVFKVMSDPFVGKMTFFRVYSGRLASDEPLYLPRTGKRERSGGLFAVLGKEQQSVPAAVAGQIVCITKVDTPQVSDTICAENDAVVFAPIKFPTPMVSLAIQPQSRNDETRLSTGLSKLTDEDATFVTRRDPQTRELVVTGMSTLHLDVMLARLRSRFDVNVNTREPKIPYLETITATSEAKYRHKKQTGGRGQYGEVYLRLEPNQRGAGFEFLDEIVGAAIPNQFIPAVEKGVRETMELGVLAGYPVVDLKCAVFDGSYHTVDSSEQAFKTAAHNAFREAFAEARPCLLEPIVNIEITVPSKFMGDVTSDINGRRGRVQDVQQIGDLQVIKAQCPMADLLRYSTELRSMTGGEGSFTMEFSHYDLVPHSKVEQIVAAAQKAKEEAK
jgi:elongation factor G